MLEQLVAEVLEFRVEHGATAIVAPYFYASDPRSPALAASLAAIGRTARRMRADGIALPTIVVLCAGLDGYECGMGIGEQAIVAHFINTRKPRADSTAPAFAAQASTCPR